MQVHSEKDIKQLNEFLRNELSAVATYGQCIEKMPDSMTVRQLTELQQSHAGRALLLQDRIVALGGKPADDAGLWGSFAKLVEGSAKLFGEQTALSVLEEGEDKGLHDYRTEVDNLSDSTRQFVTNTILPEQQRSHDTLSSLIS